MKEAANPSAQVCANCGSSRLTLHCGQCGQHERRSRRLRVRDIAGNCAEVLLDIESPLTATLIGLIRDPGRVCLDYVNGRRKRYINPFAFLLVAVTAQVILSAILRWTGSTVSTPGEPDALPDEALNFVLFAMIVPLAFLWTKLFPLSDRNFAENYVLGLYLLGSVAWLELVLLPVTFLAISETILALALPIVWLTVATWAGTVFYSMPWYSVLWRMLASTTVALVVFGGFLFAVIEAVHAFAPSEIGS